MYQSGFIWNKLIYNRRLEVMGMKIGQALAVICIAAVLLAGCAAGQDGTTPAEPGYKKITAREAKDIMDSEDAIILDVRSRDEYEKEHIQNAVLLPNTEIESLSEEMLPDKNATILIYCKSGKKSAEAAEKLAKMGYTKVYDFGGIEDWPYQTVK
jgi:rhodanese-related sulfurtransferase